jgi:hypothetical protein
MATATHDTIPCGAPGSGEHPVVQIQVVDPEGVLSPRYAEKVADELRTLLAGLECMEHGAAPAVTLTFGIGDDAAVMVVPHDCCRVLDDLVAEALDGSPIFVLIRPT